LKKDTKNYYKKARILSRLEIEDNRKSFQEELNQRKKETTKENCKKLKNNIIEIFIDLKPNRNYMEAIQERQGIKVL